jgi:RNA polymerase subunit RPABC4/transcription elongation factor Spt4
MATVSAETGSEGQRGVGDGPEQPVTCSSCGTAVPEGAKVCPTCQRSVYRTCYCGQELPANQATCPNCGADWSQSARVARKRHSHSSDRQTLLKYSLMGAGVAIGVAILVFTIIAAFAQLGARVEGADLPATFGDRVALAAAGIGRVFGQIGAFFARNALVMLGALGVLVLGAGAGAVYYLRKAAAERRLRHNKHSSSHRIRRRRREQRP